MTILNLSSQAGFLFCLICGKSASAQHDGTGYNLFIFPVFRCFYKGAIMAIRIRCKNCGSKIDAKDELLGQTRQCPKCKSSLLIVPTENNVAKTSNTKNDAKDEFKNTSDKSTTNVTAKSPTPPPLPPTSLQEDLFDVLSADEIPIVYDNMERLPTHDPPTKLLPNCRYFVFAHDRMIAHWEIGKGWQYHTGHGFVNARVNKDLLPSSGTFKFVEMIIEQKETGKQLTQVRQSRIIFPCFSGWAIKNLHYIGIKNLFLNWRYIFSSMCRSRISRYSVVCLWLNLINMPGL